MLKYQPPFRITDAILNAVASISELLAHWPNDTVQPLSPTLRRGNRIRTIQASLAIEHNTLNIEQVTSVIAGKRVLGLPREIQEVRNAFTTYEKLEQWQPALLPHLLSAHKSLMHGLVDDAGSLRKSGVGVYREQQLVHMAPPAKQLNRLLQDLLGWLQTTPTHPLIASCVFHYEFEYIHPFSDGNGRMGRLWQTLILARWKPVLAYVPVETLIHQQQDAYYRVLAEADKTSDATGFVEFMLVALQQALQELQQQTASDNERGDYVSDQVSDQVSDHVIDHISNQVKNLLQQLNTLKKASAEELMQALALKHKPTFRKNYLNPALEQGWVAMTQPDSPRSPQQRYQLTTQGKQTLKLLRQK